MGQLTAIRCRNPFCTRHPILAEVERPGEMGPGLAPWRLQLKCRACKEYTRVDMS